MPKNFIYRVVDTGYPEDNQFYAKDDRSALEELDRLCCSFWASVALVGEVAHDNNGPYDKRYPYETMVAL